MKKIWRFSIYMIVLVAHLVLIIGCKEAVTGDNRGLSACSITKYSSGKLLYLECVGNDFGIALNALHDGQKIKLVIPNGTGAYGHDRGYWILFEEPVK